MEATLANTIVNLSFNLVFALLFFGLHYSKKAIKKPLFYVIIKVQELLKQNRGVILMSKFILEHTLENCKPAMQKFILEQANKKPIILQAPERPENKLPLDAGGTGEILVDVSSTGKTRKWNKHKQDNLKLLELYKKVNAKYPRTITQGRLWDLEQCANALQFVTYGDGSKKLYQAYFCRNRLCPMCQWRRSLKLFGQVSQITDYVALQQSTIRYLFVTFTQKNCAGSELGAEFTKVNKAFKRITDKTKHLKQAERLSNNLLGYIKSVEVTYNSKINAYHPHLHVVFAVNPSYFTGAGYISLPAWRALWQKAMGLNYLPQVNAQAVQKKVDKKAVAELTKYPAKITNVLDLPTTQAIEVLADLTRFCRNRRFVSFGGILKQAKQTLKLQDVESQNVDLIGADKITALNAVGRVMYKYNSKFGCYIN